MCRGNPGAKTIGKDYYDNADKFEHSVWDEVVKAERRKVQTLPSQSFDGGCLRCFLLSLHILDQGHRGSVDRYTSKIALFSISK
jgi:hypothetical protein